MRHAPTRPIERHSLLVVLAAWAALTSGCIHNHYYGSVPVCDTGVATYGTGAVCEVPSQVVGGTVVAQGTPSAGQATIVDAPRPRRVVVSEPRQGPLLGRRNGLGWRQTDPESLATTRIEGALDDETVSR